MFDIENKVMNELIYEAFEKYDFRMSTKYSLFINLDQSDKHLNSFLSKSAEYKVAFHSHQAIKKILPRIKVNEITRFSPVMWKNREIISLNIYRDISKLLSTKCLDFELIPDYEIIGEEIRLECYSLINKRWIDKYSKWIDWDEVNQQGSKIQDGTIDWFDQNKGFGVITSSNGQHFVHKTDVTCTVSQLTKKTKVTFYSRPRRTKDGFEAYDVNLLIERDLFPQIVKYLVVDSSLSERQDVIDSLELGDILLLRREPQNPYDPNAIRVDLQTGTIVGYLDKYTVALLKSKFDKYGKPITGFVANKIIVSREGYAAVEVIFPICGFCTEEEINAFDKLNTFEDDFDMFSTPHHSSHLTGTFSESRMNETKDFSTTSDTSYWFNPWDIEPMKASSPNNCLEGNRNQDLEVKVVGVTYEGRQNIVRALSVGEEVLLEREPSNPYDRNAIKVMRKMGDQIGYLARELAASIAPEFDKYRSPVAAKISALPIGFSKDSSYGVRIIFAIPNNNTDHELDS